MSLDGYIARADGNLDWLTSFPLPPTGDYGYETLLKGIGTTIMGRLTYDALLSFGIDWPYSEYDTYIVTSQHNFVPTTPKSHAASIDKLLKIVEQIKKVDTKDIWLVGGGKVIAECIHHDCLDKMIITVIPIMIGDGIRLFTENMVESKWKLIDVTTFSTGAVNLTYERLSH